MKKRPRQIKTCLMGKALYMFMRDPIYGSISRGVIMCEKKFEEPGGTGI